MRASWALAAFLALSCIPGNVRAPNQALCRAGAVAKAQAAADANCGAYAEWDACPDADDIERDLVHDLEICDGDSD